LVSFGKAGKFMKAYLPGTLYEKILSTYSDHQPENNWKSLFTMTELFGQLAKTVANKLRFPYNTDDEKNVKCYLRQVYEERK
jgi:aminoglycoside 6-adenylyltransferase